MAKKTVARVPIQISTSPVIPKREEGRKNVQARVPDEEPAPKLFSSKRTLQGAAPEPGKIAGYSFQSAAVNFLFTQNAIPGAKLMLLNDETDKHDVREALTGLAKREHMLCFVIGIRNLSKLGAKNKSRVHVSVYDAPEVLEPFPDEIRIIDATKQSDGSWVAAKASSVDGVKDTIKNAGYVPIHPERIREVLATAVAVIPTYDRHFQPEVAVEELFSSVHEDYQETLRTAVYRFLAGVNNRRNFSGTKRAAVLRLRVRKDEESFKRLWANLQSWFEDDAGGRLVTAAYQLLAMKKAANAPVAAARMDASLAMLNKLVRFIPPSKKLIFDGWKYTPSKGE